MVISVIFGHEKNKIQKIIDVRKIDAFSVRTNIYLKNKKMGHLIRPLWPIDTVREMSKIVLD